MADVHEFCFEDFGALCAFDAPAPSALRRLTTVLMDVEVVDETVGEHGPAPDAARLNLGGPREDECLRANYADLSRPCAASVAFLDGAYADLAVPVGGPRGPCPFVLGGLGVLVLLCLAGRNMRAKNRAVRGVLDAVRADSALLEALAAKGVAVPEPCQCGGKKCVRAFLGAALFASLLSLLFGPATTLFSALFAAAASSAVKACAKCCAPAAAADEPPAYAAVVADEAPDDAAAAKVQKDAAAAKVQKDAAAAVVDVTAAASLEKPLL